MKRSRYSLLLEKLPDAFVYFRVVADCSGKAEDFVFLDLNPAFEAMIGVKKDEIIGRKITDARGCVDRLDFDWCGTYSRLTETGEALTFEHYSGPLGRWHEVTAFRDKNCYFAAIFHSISQYKQVEYEWARLSYLRAELLDNIPDCSALILKKGSREIVACNRNAREHGAVPGQKCFNVLAQRDDSCPFCQAPKLWATDKLQRIEVEYRGRWFEGIWAPLSDDFYVHYIFDITDRKLTEQKLADYTEELELLYRQLDEEMAKVGEIHKRTLPAGIPQMEKCTLATHYQPARHLGGDFYNALKVDRKVILYLSDVSGHGLGGAILSTFLKETIDSYISLRPEEIQPEKILRHLDRQYRRRNYPDDFFICIFLTVLDLETMEMSYTGAGFHVSPLVQMGNGERHQLVSKGPPISNAVSETLMDFTTGHINLTPGGTIFFNTDGLAEQRVDGIYYGTRLPDVFFQNSHLPPEVIVRAVNEDFRKFNGGTLQGEDDITFVVLQVEPL